jgi:glutamyl endopeptidase
MPFGTHWRMGGRITRANKRLTFYPMDTFGGQSGGPVWWNRTGGACTGPCGYAVHAYGVGLPGLGQTNNGRPRLTAFRLGPIRAAAGQNNP